MPRAEELTSRLTSVLEVIYLIFNEGYAATAGAEWMRPTLCEEALRLGRILAELAPTAPEVHGLIGLMEIQASRAAARVGPSGAPILLLEQDRARWDQLLIRRGLAALRRAEGLGGALGPYALQAAVAACHARARDPPARRTGHASSPCTTHCRSSRLLRSSISIGRSPCPWHSGPPRHSRSWML